MKRFEEIIVETETVFQHQCLALCVADSIACDQSSLNANIELLYKKFKIEQLAKKSKKNLQEKQSPRMKSQEERDLFFDVTEPLWKVKKVSQDERGNEEDEEEEEYQLKKFVSEGKKRKQYPHLDYEYEIKKRKRSDNESKDEMENEQEDEKGEEVAPSVQRGKIIAFCFGIGSDTYIAKIRDIKGGDVSVSCFKKKLNSKKERIFSEEYLEDDEMCIKEEHILIPDLELKSDFSLVKKDRESLNLIVKRMNSKLA